MNGIFNDLYLNLNIIIISTKSAIFHVFLYINPLLAILLILFREFRQNGTRKKMRISEKHFSKTKISTWKNTKLFFVTKLQFPLLLNIVT